MRPIVFVPLLAACAVELDSPALADASGQRASAPALEYDDECSDLHQEVIDCQAWENEMVNAWLDCLDDTRWYLCSYLERRSNLASSDCWNLELYYHQMCP